MGLSRGSILGCVLGGALRPIGVAAPKTSLSPSSELEGGGAVSSVGLVGPKGPGVFPRVLPSRP